MITLLLDHGAEVNARDAYHRTPLMHAAMQGHVDTVKLLLDRGADAALQDIRLKTALDLAEGQNRADIVALLAAVPLPKSSKASHDRCPFSMGWTAGRSASRTKKVEDGRWAFLQVRRTGRPMRDSHFPLERGAQIEFPGAMQEVKVLKALAESWLLHLNDGRLIRS